jgi:hypothetical protein
MGPGSNHPLAQHVGDYMTQHSQQMSPHMGNQMGHHLGHRRHHGRHMGHHGASYKYNADVFSVNAKDILKRAIKYLLEGLAVAFVAYYFTRGKLDWKEIILLGITAAFVFAILDTFSPTVALGTRFGAGFGIGQAMFGLNPTLAVAPLMA